MKQSWPAPERNKEPLLEVLQRVLPERGTLLELASGTGQHIAYFAAHFPNWRFVPSDIDPANLDSIRAYAAEAGDNVLEPRVIDVRSSDWAVGIVEAVFCANMIHIAPWTCCLGLFEGVGRNLAPGGVFVLYGPFSFAGQHSSQSNADFDAALKARDPSWGVRDADAIEELARTEGLFSDGRIAMPANNHCLVFRR